MFAVGFDPENSTKIITCGKSHVYFWTLSSGQFTKKQGIFGVRTSPAYSVCNVFRQFHLECDSFELEFIFRFAPFAGFKKKVFLISLFMPSEGGEGINVPLL